MVHFSRVKLSRRLLQSTASAIGVALITWIGFSVIPVNSTTIGFAYLLFVLAIASTWGFLEAALSSIVATLLFNFFFLPPILTFTIADPQNWIALFTFLATALITSRLSTKAKRRTLDAEEKQRDLERLYTFGRAILLIDDGETFAKQLMSRLADTFELEAVALYDPHTGETYHAGPVDLEGLESQLREAALQGTAFSDPDHRQSVTAIRLGAQPIASLGLMGPPMSDSLLQSLANLVAIGLERSKAQDLAREVEVVRRSERLRTTLIDAMAHELKTPLTSIRAATSALLANPGQKPAHDMEMLKIADEEAAHLDELIDDALDMAQLDSEHFEVDLEPSNLNEVIRDAAISMKGELKDRKLEVQSDDRLPPISMDRRLMKLAIKQILDNALKYSPLEAAVAVHAFRGDGTVALEITDHGKGISREEQLRIFERFYRSPSIRNQIPGSGLGLSIAHRILRAHGGDLTVKSSPGETTFRLVLPVEPA